MAKKVVGNKVTTKKAVATKVPLKPIKELLNKTALISQLSEQV